jgi:hypothetical protein
MVNNHGKTLKYCLNMNVFLVLLRHGPTTPVDIEQKSKY